MRFVRHFMVDTTVIFLMAFVVGLPMTVMHYFFYGDTERAGSLIYLIVVFSCAVAFGLLIKVGIMWIEAQADPDEEARLAEIIDEAPGAADPVPVVTAPRRRRVVVDEPAAVAVAATTLLPLRTHRARLVASAWCVFLIAVAVASLIFLFVSPFPLYANFGIQVALLATSIVLTIICLRRIIGRRPRRRRYVEAPEPTAPATAA